jgi:hypothetical protein
MHKKSMHKCTNVNARIALSLLTYA